MTISLQFISFAKATRVPSVLRSSLRLVLIYLNRIEDYVFDFVYGTNTRGKAPVSALKVVGSNAEHGTGYQASSARAFRKVMDSLAIPPGGNFVDIGSGKGRILLMASHYSFAKIIGVEFAGELCEAARRNLDAYRRKTGIKIETDILHLDAAQYEIAPDDKVFFLSNPFGEHLTSVILENIIRSLKDHPRPIWLIYVNPVWHELILAKGVFKMVKRYRFIGPGRDFVVYTVR
jgi:SAM-dependent methyltransferase